jgi:alanyl aminopeptidase
MEIVVDTMQACAVRVIAMCAVLAACGRSEGTRAPTVAAVGARDSVIRAAPVVPARPLVPAPPGLRLTDGVVPVAYDLTLELDPDRDTFTGHVAITIAVTAPGTSQLWLHAVDLDLARASLVAPGRTEPLAMLPGGDASQTRGFALPRPIGAAGGESIELVIDYTGRVADMSQSNGKDEEGLFRERLADRWYLFSQAQSIFARKFVPCFDEPRWKSAWRVTVIAPRGQVALANAPVARERELPDGRREVRFAEIAALPSYLLAVAVGPFELVDLGKRGRGNLPVRLAVAKGDAGWVGVARRIVPKVIDAVEGYLDAPLPSAKLDLVAVPVFFGAMENTGLVTVEADILVRGSGLGPVLAHELAHQWFGNLVTPAWWDHLWLSEAFATWMERRVTESLAEAPSPIEARTVRARALRADKQVDARPLLHPIASTDDIEPAFNETAYQKGAAVLATFERFVGADRFRAAVRAYLAANARTSVTSPAFLEALSGAASPEVGAALGSNLTHVGVPIVDLELRCGDAPALVASARDGVVVPVCVRFPVAATASEQVCVLAGARVEHALPAKAGCPAWLVGNAGGRGYYESTWRGTPPHAPLGLLSPEERLARGDDAAAAVWRGDLPISRALAEITALAAPRDPYGELAAVAIAREIDVLIDDALRPAWAAWLATRFRARLTRGALSPPSSFIADTLRSQIVGLTRMALDASTVAAARSTIDQTPKGLGKDGLGAFDLPVLRIAAGRDADPLFARILRAAAVARQDEQRGWVLDGLGEFPAAYASRVVDAALDGRFSAVQVWPALAKMLRRTETRYAAWRAIHARLPQLLGALTAARTRDVADATGALCDAQARAEVAADFASLLASPDGKRTLQHVLAAIDHCIARRAAAGDIAAAIAASMPPTGRLSTPRR